MYESHPQLVLPMAMPETPQVATPQPRPRQTVERSSPMEPGVHGQSTALRWRELLDTMTDEERYGERWPTYSTQTGMQE